MDHAFYVGGVSAFEIWRAIRRMVCPRLDVLETAPHMLAKLGFKARRSVGIGPMPTMIDNPWSAVVQSLEQIRHMVSEPAPTRCLPNEREIHLGTSVCPETSDPAGKANMFGLPIESRIDLVVARSSDRRNSRSRRCRVWGGRLPPAAFVSLGNSIYLSRPEFVLLQVSPYLEEVELCLLGYEMCGFYSPDRPNSLGSVRCMPLTTVKGLRRFVSSISPGVRGASRMRKALRLVLDHAGSVGETATVALLCTPRSRGGYGIPLPQLNPTVAVPLKRRELLGYNPFACDIFWPSARFAVEYDGRAYHEGAENVVRDYARLNRLSASNVRVETLTSKELFDVSLFDKFARRVAHHIDYELYTRDFGTTWHRRRAGLREAVLGYLFARDAAGRPLGHPAPRLLAAGEGNGRVSRRADAHAVARSKPVYRDGAPRNACCLKNGPE